MPGLPKIGRISEISTHQVWIRIKVSFGGNRTGSEYNFLDDGGSGLDRTDKIFVIGYNVIIVSTSQILVVIRLYTFDKFLNAKKGNVYFASRNNRTVCVNLPSTNHV